MKKQKFLFYIFFTTVRYEFAFLMNKIYKTPVVPLFIASKKGDKFESCNYGIEFPDMPHNRSEHGQSLVDQIK